MPYNGVARSCVGRRRLCQPLGTAYLVLTIVTMLGFYSITLDYARLQALRQQTGVLDTPEVAKGSPPPALAPEKAVPKDEDTAVQLDALIAKQHFSALAGVKHEGNDLEAQENPDRYQKYRQFQERMAREKGVVLRDDTGGGLAHGEQQLVQKEEEGEEDEEELQEEELQDNEQPQDEIQQQDDLQKERHQDHEREHLLQEQQRKEQQELQDQQELLQQQLMEEEKLQKQKLLLEQQLQEMQKQNEQQRQELLQRQQQKQSVQLGPADQQPNEQLAVKAAGAVLNTPSLADVQGAEQLKISDLGREQGFQPAVQPQPGLDVYAATTQLAQDPYQTRMKVRLCSQAERFRHVTEACKKALPSTEGTRMKSAYIDDIHRLIYCSSPKASDHVWKTAMAALSGYKHPRLPMTHQDGVLEDLGIFSYTSYPPDKWHLAYEKYYKFLVVRHPMERLVTVWKDKFYSKSASYKTLGRQIARRYRGEATNQKNASLASEHHGSMPTFDEFLEYMKDSRAMEKNYRSPYKTCSPCSAKFNAILRTETNPIDGALVLSHLKSLSETPPLVTWSEWHMQPRTDADLSQYYKHVSREAMRFITNMYNKDLLVFGYEWDAVNKVASCRIKGDNGEWCC